MCSLRRSISGGLKYVDTTTSLIGGFLKATDDEFMSGSDSLCQRVPREFAEKVGFFIHFWCYEHVRRAPAPPYTAQTHPIRPYPFCIRTRTKLCFRMPQSKIRHQQNHPPKPPARHKNSPPPPYTRSNAGRSAPHAVAMRPGRNPARGGAVRRAGPAAYPVAG